jgi:hypothetical protein
VQESLNWGSGINIKCEFAMNDGWYLWNHPSFKSYRIVVWISPSVTVFGFVVKFDGYWDCRPYIAL